MAVATYVGNSPAEFDHHILSPFTPTGPSPVWEGVHAIHHDLGVGTFRRIREVRRIASVTRADLLHAHSSFAGTYARLAISRARVPIVYTPHCYGFERLDLPSTVRTAFRAVEWALGWNTTLVSGCSPGETATARQMRSIGGRCDYVPNTATIELADRPLLPSQLRRVGMAGRISQQKDPRYFVEVVEQLRAVLPGLEAVWIGGGDADEERRLEQMDVRVTGWVSGADLARELGSLDLYVHSAAWEGFPLALLDSHAAGRPILARPIRAFDGLPPQLDSKEGLVLLSDALRNGHFATWSADNRTDWNDYLVANHRHAQRDALERVWSVS